MTPIGWGALAVAGGLLLLFAFCGSPSQWRGPLPAAFHGAVGAAAARAPAGPVTIDSPTVKKIVKEHQFADVPIEQQFRCDAEGNLANPGIAWCRN